MSNGSTTEEKVLSVLLLETRAISGPIRSLKVHVVDLKTALALPDWPWGLSPPLETWLSPSPDPWRASARPESLSNVVMLPTSSVGP